MCDHHFPGKVCVPDPAHVAPDGTGVPVISMDANNGDVFIGGPPGGFGHRGRLVLTNADGVPTYEIDGATGTTSQSGDIVLLDADGNERVRISGQTAEMIIKNAAGDQIIHIDGKDGDLTLGGTGQDGDLIVTNSTGDETILLDGHQAEVIAGGNSRNGDVIVRNSTNDDVIRLQADTGEAFVGGNGASGHVIVRNSGNNDRIRLNGNTGDVTVAGRTTTQDLTVIDTATTQDLTVNGLATTKDINVTDAAGNTTIEVDGNAGDIRLLGADCAEDFDIVEMENVEPGTVMVLDQQGKLRQSVEAYDKKVAGVISGAGDYRPGIVLDQRRDSLHNRLPVALMGKVYCKVDADGAPIEVGDLLTTSSTPGYAMKAGDPLQAFGAIIGKALRPQNEGKGLIPILVALQ